MFEPYMAIYAVALAGIVGFPLLWPTFHNSILAGIAARYRLAGSKPATEASRHLVVRRRRKVMHEIDTAARRDNPEQPTCGLDTKRVADISRASAKALDDLWQRAMKNSPRPEELRDDGSARKAAQHIIKEIRARRNLISGGTEFASSPW